MFKKSQITSIRKELLSKNNDFMVMFRALCDKNRFRIFILLSERCDLRVSDLAAVLDISASAVSQHLRILEISSLIEKQKKGQACYYKAREKNTKVKLLMKLFI